MSFIIDNLNKEQLEHIKDAMDKVNVDIVKDLKNGEEVKLNDHVVLYKYLEDDIVVLILSDEWIEVHQLLTNIDEVIFESL